MVSDMNGQFLVWGEPMFGFYPLDGPRIAYSKNLRMTWGGDVSNFAIGVSRLGFHSVLFTALGDDQFGEYFLNLWKDNGVDISQVVKDATRETGFYFISFADGEHQLSYHRKNTAASALSFGSLDQDVLNTCGVFHFTGTGLGMGESARIVCHEILGTLKKRDCIVSFDVNYRRDQWNDKVLAKTEISRAILSGVTHLEITDDEMLELGWGDDIDSLLAEFPSVEVIAYKRGPKGVIVKTRKQAIVCEACAGITVKDTVGAGDGFAAGFISALYEGMNLGDAARFGNVVAGLTCEGVGPIETLPSRARVTEFLHLLEGASLECESGCRGA